MREEAGDAFIFYDASNTVCFHHHSMFWVVLKTKKSVSILLESILNQERKNYFWTNANKENSRQKIQLYRIDVFKRQELLKKVMSSIKINYFFKKKVCTKWWYVFYLILMVSNWWWL